MKVKCYYCSHIIEIDDKTSPVEYIFCDECGREAPLMEMVRKMRKNVLTDNNFYDINYSDDEERRQENEKA